MKIKKQRKKNKWGRGIKMRDKMAGKVIEGGREKKGVV